MQQYKTFLTVLLCGALTCAPAVANDCNNEMYRRYNPEKCTSIKSDSGLSFATTATVAGGTLALIGGTLALISSGSDSNDTATKSQSYIHPTLPSYTQVGDDVDVAHLSSILTDSEYSRNANQYNDIRLAYSLARGFTGANSTIAILDTGRNTFHGGNVAYLASTPIAPNATIKSYQVADRFENFKTFYEIGNIINTAATDGANIYNFSWSVNKFANQVHSRYQLESMTDKNFIDALSNAAINNDAIFVWAAGNDSNSQSSALSAIPLYTSDVQGHFVNVVAWDSNTGQLASFSNACGITMNYCITAPGTNLDSPESSTLLDGTSFAAPIVSAAIAVIREAFPYMKSTEITQLLFTTARDIGDVGIDEIYGHGMLDLERATRPVGAALVPLSDEMTVALRTAHVGAAIGNQIKSQNIKFAFIDSFGRAFETQLNDNISIKNRSIGFERLRETDNNSAKFGNFEFGFKSSDLLSANGFLSTNSHNIITFVGNNSHIQIANTEFFTRTTFGITNPTLNADSMITGFSNVYVGSVALGAQYHDWTFSVGIPDTIINGNMYINIPTGRRINGEYTFMNQTIDLSDNHPSVEYSVSYKFMTAGFIDNQRGTDEFYILAKTKLQF